MTLLGELEGLGSCATDGMSWGGLCLLGSRWQSSWDRGQSLGAPHPRGMPKACGTHLSCH